jgi:ABC-type multidrug transport system fused ATPase/permease subunit
MANPLSPLAQISRLWDHLSPRRRNQLFVLVLLMMIASIAEVVSIGAALPFLGVLTSPEKIFAHEFVQPFVALLQLKSAQELLLPFTLVFVMAAIFAGLARITLLWAQTRLSMAIGADFSVQVYERTLYQPYSLHVSRNSSEILAGSQKAKDLVGSIIQPTILVLSSLVMLVAVVATLIVIQPVIALAAFSGFGLIYAVIIFITKRRIAKNSRTIAAEQGRVTKAIQEGLGGIRDVLIAGLAYILTAANGAAGEVTNAIPILGALALGAQRLLPILQQIYSAYITIKGNQASTQDALELLAQPMPMQAYAKRVRPLALNTDITLKDLGFRYTPQGPWVLRHLNLQIPKGSRVGFVGVTGSGKSTLLDIVMGLLTPTEGALLVDNTAVNPQNTRSWQIHISHVPQAIFLSDTSIAENIAFGVPPDLIDMQRVKQAAEQAQISQTIEGWSAGFDTLVGERGVRLSGGQRQRIGIARALYKRANVIIFDEATSALDSDTEAAVMCSLETLGADITVLIIAHRLTTLKGCNLIVELTNGAVEVSSDYEHLMKRVA